jgi:hypothetical protein
MAGQPATKPVAPAPAAAPARASVTPTGIPADVAEQAKRLSQPIAPRPQ